MMSRYIRKDNGFTLFEIIVVIGIMGVVSTMGAVIFSRVTTYQSELSVKVALEEKAAGAIEAIRADLADCISAEESGVPLRSFDKPYKSDNVASQYFDRQLASDEIIVPVRSRLGAAGELETEATVRYRVDRASDQHRLVRTVGGLRDLMPAGSESERVSDADVSRLVFEFADPLNNDEWTSEWLEKQHLPSAVRVSITLKDRDRPWIEIAREAVIPIHVS